MGNGTAADGRETTVPAGAPLAHERDGGPAVSGRVRDETGAALPGVTVTVARLSGEQVGRATTDGDGDYRVAVEGPGRYLVVTASGSLPPHAATVGIGTGSAQHDAHLAGGNGVRGAVSDAAGHGVDGLTVSLIDADGDVAASGRSDEAGRFALTGVPEGRYTLTAVGEGVDPVAVGVEVPAVGAAAQDLRLPQRARLTGRVTAAPDGLPVNRALATLIDADGAVVGSRLSGPDGTFTFDRLPAGSYTLATSGYPPVATVVGLEPGRVTHSDVEFPHPLDEPGGEPGPTADGTRQAVREGDPR